MKNGRSLRRLRDFWRRSATRLTESPALLSSRELRPIAARYQLALDGIEDPAEARRRLGLKDSPFRRAL